MNTIFNILKTRHTLLAVFLIVFSLQSQTAAGQDVLDGGFFAGMNTSNIDTKFSEYDSRWGGQGGFWLKLGSKWIQGEAALEYSYRSYKYQQDVIVGSTTDQTYSNVFNNSIVSTSHHITIPLSIAVGYWNMTEDNDYEGAGLTVSGGCYIDIGIAGRTKAEVNYKYKEGGSVVYDHKPEPVKTGLYGDKKHQLKRLDAGWTVGMMFGAGAGFRIGASYRHGFVNISNIDGYKIYNRSLCINFLLGFNCFD